MLSRLVKGLTEYTGIAGVEVVFSSEGYSFNLAILKKQKKLIVTDNIYTGIEEIKQLTELIPKDLPVALNLSGKGVMIRKVIAGADENPEALLAKVLPNAKADEFFLDISTSGNSTFLILLRKERVLEVFSLFEEAGFHVISASAGPSSIFPLLPLLKGRDSVSAGSFFLTLDGTGVTDIKQLETSDAHPTEIGEERLESSQIPAWSAAFVGFLSGYTGGIRDDLFESHRAEWKQKKLYQVGLKSWAIAVGLIVFINLGCYLYLSAENDKLSNESSLYASKIKKLEELENEVNRKQHFLSTAGWLSLPKASFYADRIAASVPNKVSLTSMLINPHDESASRKEKKPVFQNGKILIAGTCSDPVVLNPWLKELNSYNWIKSAGNKNYWYDHKKRNGTFEIEVEVEE